MEATKEDLNKQLKQAVRNGYIMPYQGDAARKKFKKAGDVSILETIEVYKSTTNGRSALHSKHAIGTKSKRFIKKFG